MHWWLNFVPRASCKTPISFLPIGYALSKKNWWLIKSKSYKNIHRAIIFDQWGPDMHCVHSSWNTDFQQNFIWFRKVKGRKCFSWLYRSIFQTQVLKLCLKLDLFLYSRWISDISRKHNKWWPVLKVSM